MMTFIEALTEAQKRGCAARPVGWSDRVFAQKGDAVFCYDWTNGGFSARAQIPNAARVLLGPWELVSFQKQGPGHSLSSLFGLKFDRSSGAKLSDLLPKSEPKRREMTFRDLVAMF